MNLLLLYTSFFVGIVSSSNILFFLPLGSKSHVHVFEPLISALASRNHNITVVTPYPSKSNPPNVYEISIVQNFSPIDVLGNVFEMRKKGKVAAFLSMDMSIFQRVAEVAYTNPDFHKVIQSKYDLVIFNGFINEPFYGILSKIGAPFILLTTMPAPNSLTEYTGNRLPSSFVPVPFLDLTQHMNFSERLINFLINIFFKLSFELKYKDVNQDFYRSKLGMDTPGIPEILNNVSMIFMNNHFSINSPRPNLPDNLEVGGMHCRPSKPLPQGLDKFLSEASHGFVFFSMGSIVRSSEMPESTRQVFLNVFSRLKQRVLWKWDNKHMDNLPDNVKLGNWLPQQDILGHKNIKLFMTHGGLLSTQEAAFHGVPLLGLPLFADQDLNMLQAASNGYAITIEIVNITETELENKINILLNEPRYYKRAKELSLIFRDQIETPLERAIYWTEYVIRHKGASHLRSAARELSYFQYYSYDVIAFLTFIFIMGIYIVKFILTLIYRVCCKSKQTILKSTKKIN